VTLIYDSPALNQASAEDGVPVYFSVYTGTKLDCLATEARGRKRLAQGHIE